MNHIIQFTTSLMDTIVLGLLIFVMALTLVVILVQNLVKRNQSKTKPVITKRIDKNSQLLHPHMLSDQINSEDVEIRNPTPQEMAAIHESKPIEKETEFDINDMSQYYFPDRKETYEEVIQEIEPSEFTPIVETPLIFIEMPMQEVETTVEIETELREYVVDYVNDDTYDLFVGGHATLTPLQFNDLRKTIRPNKERYPDFDGIYVIWNHTLNKAYVGQSIHVMKRLNEHFSGRGKGTTGSAMLHRDYNLGDKFLIAVVPIHDASIKNLNALERTAIAEFKAFENGYNKTRGNHD